MRAVAINNLSSAYPLIDADPYAGRVVRYFRPSDYALWAAGTAAAPSAIYAFREPPCCASCAYAVRSYCTAG